MFGKGTQQWIVQMVFCTLAIALGLFNQVINIVIAWKTTMMKTRFKPNNRSKHKPKDQHKFKETKYHVCKETHVEYIYS